MQSWVPGKLVFRREIGAPLYPSSPTQRAYAHVLADQAAEVATVFARGEG
jgi:hypothetical protein